MAAPDFNAPQWADMDSSDKKAAIAFSGLALAAAAATAPALPLVNALTRPDRSVIHPSQESTERGDGLVALALLGGLAANVLSVATSNPLPSIVALGTSKALATAIRAKKVPLHIGRSDYWTP